MKVCSDVNKLDCCASRLDKGKLKKEISNILIHDIAPNYSDRNGGYTRIIKLSNRKNDNSKLSLIEFVDMQLEGDNEENIAEPSNEIDDKKK